MTTVAISAGHSKYVRGAQGYLDEFAETSRVVTDVAAKLKALGVTVYSFIDNTSDDQSENLNRIVDWHNSLTRDVDVSVHFNSNGTTSNPIGTEAWYVSNAGKAWAVKVTPAVAAAGQLKDRGSKFTDDLFVLNNTEMPCVLIEVCFVTSKADTDLYHAHYDEIISAIAGVFAAEEEQPPAGEITAEEEEIMRIAGNSEIASYNWRDRGVAPTGYTLGFALAWAQVVKRWDQDPTVREMGKADTYDDDVDALSWYRSNFNALGMSNDEAGLDTLRHLYMLLMGLGMRESSGQHCCGRDQSASNTDPYTCEAGLFQHSYNSHDCCPEFDDVTDMYERESLKGYLEQFAEDVTCDSANWKCYGSGPGYEFQLRCKNEPAYACETASLVLRNRRQHFGPINRKEAELRREADDMLRDVQNYVLSQRPPEIESPEDDLEQRVAALETTVATLDGEVTALQAAVTELDRRVMDLEQAAAPAPAKKKSSKSKSKTSKK